MSTIKVDAIEPNFNDATTFVGLEVLSGFMKLKKTVTADVTVKNDQVLLTFDPDIGTDTTVTVETGGMVVII